MELIEFKSPVLIGCYTEDIWMFLLHLPTTEGIYLLTDKNRNLKYVGSSVNVRRRVMGYYHPNSTAYKRYPFLEVDPGRLKAELLEDCAGMDISDIRKREAYWIRKLDTLYPNGLNVNAPSKGFGISVKDYNRKIVAMKITPCYQLLRFSVRIGFYAEMVRSTPANPAWFTQNSFGNKPSTKRMALSHMKYAEIGRPNRSY